MTIKIDYNGSFPNLCRGILKVTIDEKIWVFPNYCMESGGCVSFDDNMHEHVTSGSWSISDWPKDFPENYKQSTVDAINDQIPSGCCGGCV